MLSDRFNNREVHCLPFHRELPLPQLSQLGPLDPGEERGGKKRVSNTNTSGESTKGYFPTCYNTWNAKGCRLECILEPKGGRGISAATTCKYEILPSVYSRNRSLWVTNNNVAVKLQLSRMCGHFFYCCVKFSVQTLNIVFFPPYFNHIIANKNTFLVKFWPSYLMNERKSKCYKVFVIYRHIKKCLDFLVKL